MLSRVQIAEKWGVSTQGMDEIEHELGLRDELGPTDVPAWQAKSRLMHKVRQLEDEQEMREAELMVEWEAKADERMRAFIEAEAKIREEYKEVQQRHAMVVEDCDSRRAFGSFSAQTIGELELEQKLQRAKSEEEEDARLGSMLE